MILNALVDYYDRMAADPESDVAPFGFSKQKISFEILLKSDGALSRFNAVAREEEGRRLPRLLIVPGQSKPSGSGLNPGFLWDNSQYMLGFKPDDPRPERSRAAFEAFRDRHLAAEMEIDDSGFSAVCRFLKAWSPETATQHPELADVVMAFGVFRFEGAQEYVQERAKVREYWVGRLGTDETGPLAPSLLSGERQPIARLHEPKIKGVRGSQSAGALLVSFNEDAYESYGKSQSFNAPVGVQDAFKYCTALNALTMMRSRQAHLGDTTVVFWAGKPHPIEDDLATFFEGADSPTEEREGNGPAEDRATISRLTAFLDRLRRAAEGVPFEGADVPFYLLGLSPNAGRISVRFWIAGTVETFAERLGRHLFDMEMAGRPQHPPPISLQRILDQTARERADIPPLLGGAVLRAVLTGGPYPTALATAVLRRIRANGQTKEVDEHIRASILKAWLIRNARRSGKTEGIAMGLDLNCQNKSYLLGRLLAVLESVQREAFERKLNTTIKDRYFSAASAHPRTAFVPLMKLSNHHLRAVRTEKPKLAGYFEKLIEEIYSKIVVNDSFPAFLPLDEQCLFFVGYYHQRSYRSIDAKDDSAFDAQED